MKIQTVRSFYFKNSTDKVKYWSTVIYKKVSYVFLS